MHSRTASHTASLLVFSIVLVASTLAAAQAGQLDPTFGPGGIVTTDFGNGEHAGNSATANAVILQPDGKIVVVGGAPGSNDGFPAAAVARYNTDGSLDTSFGTAGIAIAQGVPPLNSVALQSDGKIVASASGQLEVLVARFNSNGSLDSSFATAGIFTSSFPLFTATGPSRVAIERDGKILLTEGVMLLLSSNGTLDTSFGVAGEAVTVGDFTPALSLLSDAKILAGLFFATGFADGGLVARYNPNGSLDTSFGVNGQMPTIGSANALLLLNTGEFVVGGNLTSSISGPTTGFSLSRYLGVGFADPKFGTRGGVVTPVPNYSNLATSGLGAQSTGDLVILGTASNNQQLPVFALARYTPTGQLDSTFGTAGIAITSFGSDTVVANGLAIQTDDKIVTVGSYSDGFDTGYKLARYLGH